MLYSLSHSPRCYAKLRSIIISEFGTFASPRDLTFTRLRACSYLQYCINETLRLYSPLPLSSRVAVTDTVLPRGGGSDGLSPIFVPKGLEVVYSSFIIQRRKDLWGEDSEEWKPERWEGQKINSQTGYIPFGLGPRMCIGRKSSFHAFLREHC